MSRLEKRLSLFLIHISLSERHEEWSWINFGKKSELKTG